MSEICDWVQYIDCSNEKHFLRRLFNNWDSEKQGALTFSDLITGLNKLVETDLMASISNFLNYMMLNKMVSLIVKPFYKFLKIYYMSPVHGKKDYY